MNQQTVLRDTVVTLDYNVTDSDGNVVDPGEKALIYLHGGYGDIFDRIEEVFQGRATGETVTVKLCPEEAFGDYDPSLIQIEPREFFPAETTVGMQFEGAPHDADEDDILIYRVTDIVDDKIVLDANHPLAGMSLVFTGTVLDVRPASVEEIAHGHVYSDNDDNVCLSVGNH